MGYRSVVSNPELEIDLAKSRITREEWEKIDREVVRGGLGENLEFRTWFTRGDKGEEVLASLEVVEGSLEPYTAYDLVEQMGRLRELLMSHGVERFSLGVTRTGDADASNPDVERVRITPEGVFTQHAEITFSEWGGSSREPLRIDDSSGHERCRAPQVPGAHHHDQRAGHLPRDQVATRQQ